MIPASAAGGLDREQMRQVFIHIGRPRPRRATVLGDLMGAVRLVPRRTLMLLILLGLAVLLGLTARAEPVQKGQGGVGSTADNPLRDRANFFGPCAQAELYNFLQNFPKPCAQAASPLSPAPVPAPGSRRAQRPVLDTPTKLSLLLCFIAMIILWLHLRSVRPAQDERPTRRRPR
jgi:hypothetical protein